VKAPKDGPGVYPFVHEFIEEQDAFVPGWSTFLFEGHRHKRGENVKLAYDELDEIVERFDFMST
jgi:hypothetical protein